MDYSKKFDNGELVLNGSIGVMNDGKGTIGLLPPSLNLTSAQIKNYSINVGGALGQGLNFGLGKEPGAAGSPFGYNIGVSVNTEGVSVSPELTYDLANGIIV